MKQAGTLGWNSRMEDSDCFVVRFSFHPEKEMKASFRNDSGDPRKKAVSIP